MRFYSQISIRRLSLFCRYSANYLFYNKKMFNYFKVNKAYNLVIKYCNAEYFSNFIDLDKLQQIGVLKYLKKNTFLESKSIEIKRDTIYIERYVNSNNDAKEVYKEKLLDLMNEIDYCINSSK